MCADTSMASFQMSQNIHLDGQTPQSVLEGDELGLSPLRRACLERQVCRDILVVVDCYWKELIVLQGR